MYILPMLTHLEVVALGDRSDISPDQHLNYASNNQHPVDQTTGSGGVLQSLRIATHGKKNSRGTCRPLKYPTDKRRNGRNPNRRRLNTPL